MKGIFLAEKGSDIVPWVQSYAAVLLPILHWLWIAAILLFFGIGYLQRGPRYCQNDRLALRLQWTALVVAAIISAAALLPGSAAMVWFLPLGGGLLVFWVTAVLPPRWRRVRDFHEKLQQGAYLDLLAACKHPWPNQFAVERWHREMLKAQAWLQVGQPLRALHILETWTDRQLFPWERRRFQQCRAAALLACGYPETISPCTLAPGKFPWQKRVGRQQWIDNAMARSTMHSLKGEVDSAVAVVQAVLEHLAEPSWQLPENAAGRASVASATNKDRSPATANSAKEDLTGDRDSFVVESTSSTRAAHADGAPDTWPLYRSLAAGYWQSWEREQGIAHMEHALSLALASRKTSGQSADLFHQLFLYQYEQNGPQAAAAVWQRWIIPVRQQASHTWAQVRLVQVGLSCPDAVPWTANELEEAGNPVWEQLDPSLRLWFLHTVADDAARGEIDPDPWLLRYLGQMENIRRGPVETRCRSYRGILQLLGWYQGRAHSFEESLERPAQQYLRDQALDELQQRLEQSPRQAVDLRAWCLRERIAIIRQYAPQRHPQRQIYEDYQRLLNLYEWAERPRDVWETQLGGLEHAIDGLDDLAAQKLLRVLSASWTVWQGHPAVRDDHLRLAYCATRLNDLDTARRHWRLLEASPHPASGFRPDPNRFWVDEYLQVVAGYLRPGVT